MRKLTLDLEALDVEAFSTGTEDQKGGTVHGHITLYCSVNSCDDCNTIACASVNEQQCTPTMVGLTCMYDTCGACNQTDPNCTNYCPTGIPANCPTGAC
ncbi:MAG: hypothetical protein JO306_09160 [Gemmatimonadetes bacterium]|nr:hypothetical protein [Gemmatimonadota bacterium]